MKFRLPRQVYIQDVNKIILREIRKSKLYVPVISKKKFRELKKIIEIINTDGMPKYLVRRKMGNLGHGIFLHPDAEPIKRGQIIAPYAGEVSIVAQNDPDDSAYAFAPLSDIHLNKKEQEAFDEDKDFHPRRLYALNLDAEKKGNFTRFINHSEKPNIEAQITSVPKNNPLFPHMPLEIIYVAKKTIRPGEQLLVCYEDEEKSYWNAYGIKPFPMRPNTYRVNAKLRVIRGDQK